ncbi:high-affinity nickel-transport protein [Promicromonospora sp. AC04]|uniref:HoxN/HupN/NixA family nickel/cobalt transporter n=1 Tax=Promicromonospora sp. AC04 TaxID=2135723 RepID=UPI000D3CBA3A|nr:high-affinity nickel-transport protein [Promicromonospora sp. AC04]PUB31903.1 high-affinity nickel-transport protein [Promicromonospora sp. AC04]
MTSTHTDQLPDLPARRERRGATVPVVVALHVVGIGGLAATLAADGGTGAITVAIGLAAYALGLRHAFDADHIATIDNTTRRLVRTDRDARGVGLWFSLGHSTVVLGAALLLALGVHALAPLLDDESSPLRRATGVWGPLVSGTFLLVIAAVNIAMLRTALRARAGGAPGTAAPGTVAPRTAAPGSAAPRTTAPGAHTHHAGGPVTWVLRRFEWSTDRPARMYVVGLVFGLGFDTATEIGLLAITASAAVGQVAWYSALPLAVLFAAGMSLLDSAQGAVARRVYARAGTGGTSSSGAGAPVRALVRYDVVVTGVSALAALGIGLVTLVQVAVEHAPWLGWMPGASVSLEPYGVVLTVVLLLIWGAGSIAGVRSSR